VAAAPRSKNPHEGTSFYVNPEYVRDVNASIAKAPANKAAMERVRAQPTAVWLDRIATIEGSSRRMGIEAHLDEALAQQARSTQPEKPMLITFVVYNLPNRDCASFASNGELTLEAGGLAKYKTGFIDEIAKRLTGKPAYQRLRFVIVIEPDSIPNAITNVSSDYPKCMTSVEGYKEGVRYAVAKLGAIGNAYLYLDIAHSGWLGWAHTARAMQFYRELLTPEANLEKIRGFAANIANYSALKESNDPYANEARNQNVIAGFYEGNRMIDELGYVAAWKSAFPDKGIIIDTSRNGWRPTADGSPIERRAHRGNWCNVSRAGIGERPRASPEPGIDAYVWVKPPGESDGTSDSSATRPNDEGKRFDRMCGTAAVVRPYSKGRAIPTDALGNAPHAGHWFHEQFVMLVKNATPPL
jgi:cellulose 1,4-beta-cellobiosidase